MKFKLNLTKKKKDKSNSAPSSGSSQQVNNPSTSKKKRAKTLTQFSFKKANKPATHTNKKRFTFNNKKNKIEVSSFIPIKVIVILGFIIPIALIILLGILSYQISSRQIGNNYKETAIATVSSSGKYLELGLDSVFDFALQTSLSEEVSGYYSGNISDFYDIMTTRKTINNDILTVQSVNNFINSVTVIGDIHDPISTQPASDFADGQILNTSSFLKFKEYIKENKTSIKGNWEGTNSFLYDLTSSNFADNSACVYLRPILGNIGTILIDVPKEILVEELNALVTDERMFAGFMTRDGRLTSCNNSNTEDTTNLIPLIQDAFDYKEEIGVIDTEINGQATMLIYNRIENDNFVIFQTIPNEIILEQVDDIKTLTYQLVIISIILSIVTCTIIGLVINKKIKTIVKKVATASKGDLTVKFDKKRQDEFEPLTVALNIMINNVKGLIHEAGNLGNNVMESTNVVDTSSKTVLESSMYISSAIKDIQTGMEQQRDDSQNCLNNMELLANKIVNVSDSTERIDLSMKDAMTIITDGKILIEDLNSKTEKSASITQNVIEDIMDLANKSHSIKGIVNAIEDISSETNLLSLNASIEAARVGEAGKGFSVVATEIRKLSEQSAHAAKNIYMIINEITNQTDRTVETAKDAEEIVIIQKESLKRTTDLFDEINKKVIGLVSHVNEIMLDVQNIEQGKNVTLSAIENITSVQVETTAAATEVNDTIEKQLQLVEELKHAVTELTTQASQLDDQIKQFTT